MKRLLIMLSCVLLFGCQSNQPQVTLAPAHAKETDANLQSVLVDPLTKNYFLVLDSSGSMAGDRLDVAKKAVKKFISIVPANANIGLLEFGGSVRKLVPLTTNRDRILNQLDSIDSGGGTPLIAAITSAYSSLKSQYSNQFEYGEYHMVVLTDGDGGDGDPLDRVSQISKEGWCTIHTIGFKIGESHALNSPDKVRYRSADNLQELEEGFKSVLAEAETFDISFN